MSFPFFSYMSYVLRHKWYVFWACCRYGLVWRGLVHDMSKFRPSEFGPYKRYFHGRKIDPQGYRKPADTGKKEFEIAWLHHQRRNKHHFEYWCYVNRREQLVTHEMPLKYRKEMVADWYGAGKAQRAKTTTREWYLANRNTIFLGPDTRAWVEAELGLTALPDTDTTLPETKAVTPVPQLSGQDTKPGGNTAEVDVAVCAAALTGGGRIGEDFSEPKTVCNLNTASRVLTVCGKVHKVYYSRVYKQLGFESFDGYIKARTRLAPRQALAMVSTYRWFLKLPIPVREQLQDMPWEKVSKVVGIVTPANAEEWLHKLREYTTEGLSREIRSREV